MLIPFAIDPASLEPDETIQPAQLRSQLEALFDIWQKIGLLVHEGENLQDSQLYHAIQKLPPKIRLLWLHQLAKVPRLAINNDWNGHIQPHSLAELPVVVVLVNDQRAFLEFGVPQDMLSNFLTPQTEVCRISAAHRAKTFLLAQLAAGVPLPAGTDLEQIWQQRFKTLVLSNYKRISIVDRYALHNLFNQPQLAGLQNFLTRLASTALDAKHLTLFAAHPGQDITEITATLQQLLSQLPQQRIQTLNVQLLPDAIFATQAPDSYIRFERYSWDIGSGLSLFAQPVSTRLTLISFKSGSVAKSYQTIEQQLTVKRLANLSITP